ncbi:exopolysaccharide biosynthesis protein [Aurantiacibacter luteus]|uniref:exopolysaccharide biosynthesis protein n=1 Tax=Aurantiacibacter luteus TaxID=1581420 RepID=UPI0007B03FB7|nr:exopolysaccharide biosynthesis protein [Aurantiacibacter luteus]
MSSTPYSVGDILDCLEELSEECDSISVERIVGAFGTRTFGPAIMVPALLEITPVGAIPGVPTFLAVTIALVAGQKMLGKRHLWLPKLIADRCVSAEKLRVATHKLRPLAGFLDRHFHRRLKAMTRAPFAQIAAGVIIVLCLAVPFLEVLPFASSAPMLAIAGFGLAVLVRDGVLMALALAASLSAIGLMGWDYADGGLSDTEEVDGVVKQETVDAVEDTAAQAGAAIEQGGAEAAEAVGEVAQDAADGAGDAVQDIAEDVAD